jgi:DNA-binding transcriptional LysR family regulator
MSRIDTLKVFAEVVNTRNFTSAAKRLGLTPSAVSKQISMLEDRLGVRLLNRTTRAVSPTEAGQLYFERCRAILEDLEEAESMIADLDSTPKGVLKVAAEPIFGRAILARIIADYTNQFSDVQVELFLTDHSLELVKQGFDAGIHLGELQDPSLSAVTFANHRMVMCASPQYLEAYGEPASADALREHRLIRISNLEFQQPVDQFAVVTPQVERGRLARVLEDLSTESLPVQLVYQAHRHVSMKSKSFFEYMQNYFR